MEADTLQALRPWMLYNQRNCQTKLIVVCLNPIGMLPDFVLNLL